MPRYPTLMQTAGAVLVAIAGVALYVPAAIGLGVTQLLRRRQTDDSGWRFTLAHIEAAQTIAVTPQRKADLWSQMNLKQYFTLVPGATAVARGYCAFSRPLSHA